MDSFPAVAAGGAAGAAAAAPTAASPVATPLAPPVAVRPPVLLLLGRPPGGLSEGVERVSKKAMLLLTEETWGEGAAMAEPPLCCASKFLTIWLTALPRPPPLPVPAPLRPEDDARASVATAPLLQPPSVAEVRAAWAESCDFSCACCCCC